MYNTNTASVNLKVTALTSDTLYRLAELLTGDRYATLQFTADECKAIEMNAYAANMGAESKESAWTRFCELCFADKAVSDGVKDRLGAEDLNRYEVRTFTEDGEELTAKGQCYADRAEAIKALTEAMEDSEAHHGFVYDDLAGDATYSMEKSYRYTVARDYHEDKHFNTAEETADFIADTLCDSYEGEEAYNDMLDECSDEVNICGMTYLPSECLKKVDPIAYRCGLSDWADGERSDILYRLERMDDGDTESCTIAEVTLEAVLICYDITTHEEAILPLVA